MCRLCSNPTAGANTGFEDAAASRGLTVTYFHLHEAQCVNVGTALSLPHPLGRLTSLQVNEIEAGRSSVVVAGFTPLRDGNTAYRAKES